MEITQDPNTWKVQNNTIDFTKHNMQSFGVIPFINLQNYYKMTLNN